MCDVLGVTVVGLAFIGLVVVLGLAFALCYIGLQMVASKKKGG